MGKPTTKTELLLTTEHELVKQYQQIDGLGRPNKIYTASVYAKTGDYCLVTELFYQTTTSTVVKGKKEGYAQWSESFIPDSSFTVTDKILTTKTEIIVVNENELAKQYQELDLQDRVVRLYEGPVWVTTGDPVKVTEFIFQNSTSTVFKGKKEGYALWDASWIPDSLFTVDY
jgi:hypothetical protein